MRSPAAEAAPRVAGRGGVRRLPAQTAVHAAARTAARAAARAIAAGLAAAACLGVPAAQAAEPNGGLPPSASAQRLYEDARDRLLQIRTLLRGQDSQASTGSGFVVSAEGHAITNYHVVSQAALQPQRYRLVYEGAGGDEGTLQLLAFDAIHDLALVRLVPEEKTSADAATAAPRAHAALAFRPRSHAVARGERIYSLGNPLDVGFAVLEGNYNGLVERSFYPSIFFGGALNPGMSGGPALDEAGRVVGVNVATRLDGQQVSFLVPGEFAEDLLARFRGAAPITEPVYPELTRQLFAHQELLTHRLVDEPWRASGDPRYAIPVPSESFMRCWGHSTPADTKGLQYTRSDCAMENPIFVSESLATGMVAVRHEAYDGSRLGPLRFAAQYSASFRNEWFGAGDKQRTPPQCHERYVDSHGLPLRAVLCLSAYRKLPGLYDLSVLVATLDAGTTGAQGRLDARGLSFQNALKLADHYLQGYAWKNGAH